MSSTTAQPALSVVIPTDTAKTLEPVVERLAAQTVADVVELVVVCPSAKRLGPLEGTGRLGAVQVCEHPLLPLGEARAAGVAAAAAPLVAIGETHAYPSADWAELLLRAFEDPWGIVVPAIRNGNPGGGVTSWSGFLIDYGRWATGHPAGEVADPPIYNAAFRRAPLLELAGRLGRLLEPGSTLVRELAAGGHRTYHEAEAHIEHLNISRARDWLYERYLGGRLLAAARRERWPRRRTLVYLAGSPLVPLVRIARSRPAFVEASRRSMVPLGTRPAAMLALVAWGLGEAAGYAFGGGRAEERMLEYELHKARWA